MPVEWIHPTTEELPKLMLFQSFRKKYFLFNYTIKSLLLSYQYGFVSLVQQQLALRRFEGFISKMKTVMVYTHLSKAFDNHNLLLHKLVKFLSI